MGRIGIGLSVAVTLACMLFGCSTGEYASSRDCKLTGLHIIRAEPFPVKGYAVLDEDSSGVDVDGKPAYSSGGELHGGADFDFRFVDYPSANGRPAYINIPAEPGLAGIYRFSVSHRGDPRCSVWETNEVVSKKRGESFWSPGPGRCVAIERIADLAAVSKERVFLIHEHEQSWVQDRLWDRQLGTLATSSTLFISAGWFAHRPFTTCSGTTPRNRSDDIPTMLKLLRPAAATKD